MCFYCDRKGESWWWQNYVCWNCRVQNGVCKSNDLPGGRVCYKCNQPMIDVGFKFRTPKKKDVKQWKHLEKTWENQYRYIGWERINVGPRPRVVKQAF